MSIKSPLNNSLSSRNWSGLSENSAEGGSCVYLTQRRPRSCLQPDQTNCSRQGGYLMGSKSPLNKQWPGSQQLFAWGVIKIIRVYQLILSPDHGLCQLFFPRGVCRYYPTCSEYACQAIGRYGWRGALLAARRLVRCHPFAAGGLDPVNQQSKFLPPGFNKVTSIYRNHLMKSDFSLKRVAARTDPPTERLQPRACRGAKPSGGGAAPTGLPAIDLAKAGPISLIGLIS